MLARSNYEVQFQPQQSLSERIIFQPRPRNETALKTRGSFCFASDDGTHVYYATFHCVRRQGDHAAIGPGRPTSSFFRFITPEWSAAENKGMALFPRKINGLYAMLFPPG